MKWLSIPAGIAALLAVLAVGFALLTREMPAASAAVPAEITGSVPKLTDRIAADQPGLDAPSFSSRFVGDNVLEVAAPADDTYVLASIDDRAVRPMVVRTSVATRSLVALASPAAPEKQSRPASSALGELDGRTAIYDIAAHTIYLPDGDKLEAHSGLGYRFDDPRFVKERNRGPTPPNLYALSLRERRFHGVQALRLTPIGDGNMYGRDGILAHTYMLGPKGQSNGCLVMRNYPAFLRAYLNGKIERVLVVDHLAPNDRRLASLM
jgi:hypothetical protein